MSRKVCFILFIVSSLLTFSFGIASASVTGIQSHTLLTSASQWSAVAVPQGAAPIPAPLVMSWNVNQGTAYQYFDIVNTGSLSLSGQTFAVTSVYDKGGRGKPPTVTFEGCINGTWSASTQTCSGSVINMGSTTSELFTSLSTPIHVGNRLSARAKTSPGASNSYITTVNVQISRSQIRSGTTSNN